ncbi:flavin-containing monooxygenase [Pararhizobium sp.]|uniref:flavin-containing monooxygenase n=1 Tax=Pararhizobium sp. TaxID=1977563 RepID=UPI0027249A84|nr:NAD(P)/FAD-dependent oxidoreductase [Pararhizobium sp.]MDO9414721.1 NAD(P)/FAD-dependent oxidoreductase [Pararhizobium sp.]
MVRDVVVIGSGLAGLTVAHALKSRGIDALILEKEADVGASWARRHPQLTLNTHRNLSALPGLAYPPGTGAFPKRDAVVAHIKAFRDRHGFEIRHGVEALSITREGGGFLVETTAGGFQTRHLIVATGRDAVPSIPAWPGLEQFQGRVVHAADFGDAADYAEHAVLVVGGGNSGFDILNHLSRVKTGEVWLSLRRSPGLLPKRLGRFAVHRLSPLTVRLPTRMADWLIAMTQRIAFGDLSRHGFPPGRVDAATRLARDNIAIAVDDGAINAIKRGQITVVADVVSFSVSAALLSDGRSIKPDVVIAAAGYLPSLKSLLGPLGVIDAKGAPIMPGKPGATAVPGLYLAGMRASLTSYFLQVQGEADAIARAIVSSRGA